jgi:hypothetical protein
MFTLNDIKSSPCGKLNTHLFSETKVKKSKYGNKKTVVDGIKFDSAKEAKRYGELKMLLKAGHIGLLQLQVVYRLEVDGKLICKYVADFEYIQVNTGETVVEDVKSAATRKLPVYRLKKKLMKELLGIEIKEV